MKLFRPFALLAALFVGPLALAQAPAGYYASVDTSSAVTLRVTLHAVIDDHQWFPYTAGSTDTWNVLEAADEDPGNATRILDVYRNASYAKHGGGNTDYNREHTWPKSYGFPDEGGSNYPHNDCHQLYLSNIDYNGARGNLLFGTCSASCSEEPTLFNAGMGGGSGVYPGNSNWANGGGLGTWETWSSRKGDVARALLYLDVRYEGGTHGLTGAAEPNLVVTDDEGLIASSNTGSNLSTAYMGRLATLLAWHAADPVDALEAARNDTVFGFQGNRNPFVDHPEWVDCLWAGVCNGGNPGGGGTAWINELHYDNAGTDVDEAVEVAGTAGASLVGWQLVAYNGSVGTAYQTLNLAGTLPDLGGCRGAMSFPFANLQNGAPDGIALVDEAGVTVEFLSYEGSFTAVDGPAAGMTSVDIVVEENSSTAVGTSLQLTGTGSERADFTWSASAAATPGALNGGQTFDGGCAPPPPAPDGLVATGLEASVLLNWNAVAEASAYRVLRSTTSGGPYATIDPAVGSNSFVDLGLTNGTTYHYVVRAVSANGLESPDSAEAAATPQDQSPPSTPTGVAATPGDGIVALTWNANPEGDVASYIVSRAPSFFGPYTNVGTPVMPAFDDTTVVNDSTYFYIVVAVDTSSNASSPSTPIAATPTDFVPPTETVRNGTPPNPLVYSGGLSGGPVVGAVWDPIVAPFAAGAFAHFALVQPDGIAIELPSVLGTLLVNVPTSDLIFFAVPGAPFAIPVPADPALIGFALVTQGGALSPGPVIELTNALDVTLGG
ncbi:MAG: endonuclease [Planctomycetota bacterium]